MQKLKLVLSFMFTLGIICLGFSFAFNFDAKITAKAVLDRNEIIERIVNGESVEKGGAIYLSAGATYNMSGGEISGHFAEKGGAVYIGDGAVFTMTGGTITGNYAKYGGAIYVASGGECYINGGTITGNFAENAPAIYVETGGLLQVNNTTALVDGNETINMTPTPINIYVDGTLSKTIAKLGDSYIIDESEMPLQYENCCGYFYDEQLSKCTNGVVNLTSSEEVAFAPRRATANSEGINIYTKTASNSSNFTFTLNSTTNTYEIKASSTSISGSIVLPKEYNNVQTSLFEGKYSTQGAFYNCKSVTGITFQDGLTKMSSGAFNNCNNIIGSLIIPDSVTSIGYYAFQSCSGFTGSLTIPDSVTSIGDYAFSSCSGFTGSLTIPENVTSIGNYAFYSCSGFTGSLSIPDSVTSIGIYAFYSCRGFTGSLTIGNSVTSIGNYAFYSC
ncbi:MAG: leucine-rich repeat domain-containing protein, partial [Clostridia bacterium]|nr:leucine-rich repeat domain-containing protein [Clostridia bacterium]